MKKHLAAPSHPSAARARGFTLIEVMVALIVLVLGVLGASAMTLNALRDGKQSGLRSQASSLAYELADLVRKDSQTAAERAVFLAAQPTAGVGTCWTTGCVPADMATNDFYEWLQKVSGTNGLPNGQAVVCRDATKLALANYPACDNLATSPLVVKLRWDEKSNNARDAAVSTGHSPYTVTPGYLAVTFSWQP